MNESNESERSERPEETSEGERKSSEDDENKINYKLCCLYDKTTQTCGPYVRDRLEKSGLVCVGDLTADTKNHFRNLRFKDYRKL